MGLLDLLSIKSKLGTIEIDASLEEILTDTLQITEHPVELGAAITDHAYMRPSEVVITCGWSNAGLNGLFGTAKGIASALFSGGSLSNADYISGVYSQLVSLQQSRTLFSITTQKRTYKDMLIVGLQSTTDQKTSSILMVQATCRQVIVVSTQTTTLPPASQQANPASTASIANTGVNQGMVATPSPGGSVIPSIW